VRRTRGSEGTAARKPAMTANTTCRETPRAEFHVTGAAQPCVRMSYPRVRAPGPPHCRTHQARRYLAVSPGRSPEASRLSIRKRGR
jgi:hypothetical protein